MAQTPTTTAELLGYKLGVPDALTWITQHRDEGWSYGRLSVEIYAQAGMYITAQTLKTWVTDADRAAS